MSEYAERLAQGEESWSSVPDAPEEIPAAIYTFQLQDAKIEEINDRLFIVWEHLVDDGGEQDGQVTRDLSTLEPNPDGNKRGNTFAMSRTKVRLAKMCEFADVPFPEDRRDTEATVAAIFAAAPRYRGKVTKSTSRKNGREYTNVELLEMVEKNGSAPPPQATPTPTPAAEAPEGESAEMPDVGDVLVFSNEGEEARAKVTSIEGSNIHATDLVALDQKGNPQDWTFNPTEDDYDVEAGATDAPDEDADALLEFASAVDVAVPPDADKGGIVAALNTEGPYDSSTLTDDEKALLARYGVKTAAPEVPPPPPKPKPKPKRAVPKPKRAAKKAARRGPKKRR